MLCTHSSSVAFSLHLATPAHQISELAAQHDVSLHIRAILEALWWSRFSLRPIGRRVCLLPRA